MKDHLQLAITKIGDLLYGKKITEGKEGNPIADVFLKIPEYQRPYKWTAKNANQLLDDIEEARAENKEVYRVGTLILHYEEKGGERAYNIVDGQQRTITFALLLSCFSEEPIDFLNQPLADNLYNFHNVTNNYKSLKRRVDKIADEKTKKDLYEYIKDRCELIVVITEDISEAFQFFDSQNARGKTLYPHDLLKAYHLREMNGLNTAETESTVKTWEDMNQKELSVLFNEYLYRIKEWVKGNKAFELNERNIELFKGVTANDNHPYAQFYKGAFAYAEQINNSLLPFVAGILPLSRFQLNAPIIAGKPFFEYAKHYFDILADIQDNDKYEGYFINDNEIIDTLNLREYKNGVGNGITRLMLDTAILLYVDRFCPDIPTKNDINYLNQFVIYAFVWAYSMRAQYKNVGWQVAQNYIMGESVKDRVINGFNIYKVIADSDSPKVLLGILADRILPLDYSLVKKKPESTDHIDDIITNDNKQVYKYYLHYFKQHGFLEGEGQ